MQSIQRIISIATLVFAHCSLAQTPPSPQAIAQLQKRLENTQWSFVNTKDIVTVGGATVVKKNAWLSTRLRPNGRYTAWGANGILRESKWEAVDKDMIRLLDVGADPRVGLLMRFDAALTSFTCVNEPQSSGKFMNRLGGVDSLVGRWHWNGPGTVHFREDGMAWMEWPNGEKGRWRPVGSRYEVSWANGKYVDTIRIKSGEKELACEDKRGRKFGAWRVVPK